MEHKKPSRLALDFAACVLFVAAALKGYSLLVYPTPSGNLLESRWFQVLLAGSEILIAGWLLSTIRVRLATNVAVGLFAAFALFSLGKWWQGAESCGCFGVWTVHPQWTFLLDTAALMGLVALKTVLDDSEPVAWRQWLFRGAIVAATLFFGFALKPVGTTLGTGGLVVQKGELILLEPETWVGKACPILEFIDCSQDLRSGEVLVVLVRHDCHTCEERIPGYQGLADRGEKRVALIEVPPYGPTMDGIVSGKLREDADWFVQTPAEILLQDGIVLKASHESESLKHLAGG